MPLIFPRRGFSLWPREGRRVHVAFSAAATERQDKSHAIAGEHHSQSVVFSRRSHPKGRQATTRPQAVVVAVSGRTRSRDTRRGWRGSKKRIARVVRRRKPDDPISWIGTWALLAVGLLGLYFAGTVGLIAVVVLLVLAAFAIGLATRGVKRVVRRTRSRTNGPRKSRIDAGSRTDEAEESDDK
jgi:hypothetical protein